MELLTDIKLSDKVFRADFNEALVHQLVTTYRAKARAGSKAQKTRSEVSGGGSKPWRQKGTGRARSGTSSSPLWRGGGVTFAAKPRDYSKKLNKKMYRAAMRSIFSELLRQERLLIVDAIELQSNKTKDLLKELEKINLNNVLIVTSKLDDNLYLASRNLYSVGVCDVLGIEPLSLLGFDKVLVTKESLSQIEERYA
ncbi:MAG: 50S ribosomal protein L4 [Gammaproteobacteria bacterium]|nr:50S ribosomal protein L4 [Gammaproteobacteria bacterium]